MEANHHPSTPPGDDLPERGPLVPGPATAAPRFLWAYALVAGLAAGVAGWAVGEATYDHYRPSKEAASQAYAFNQLNLEKDVADGLNAAVAYGSLGALTGLALGLTGGWARRSARGAILGGVAGLILGGVAGAATSPPLVPLFRKYYEPHAPDLKLPLLIHGAIWCTLGAAAGLAFGIGLGDRRRVIPAAVGGLVGAAIATLLYNAMGAVLFPFAEADLPISPSMLPRFLSRVFVAVGVALGAVWAVGSGGKGVKPKIPLAEA